MTDLDLNAIRVMLDTAFGKEPTQESLVEALNWAKTLPAKQRVIVEQVAADWAGTLPSAPGPLATYYNRWSAFARDMVIWPDGWGLKSYQNEALDELQETGRLSLRGPHGLGKGSVVSLALLAFSLTRDDAGRDWKVPTTASVWNQLEQFLWPEVHKWIAMLDWEAIGRPPFVANRELLSMGLRLKHGRAFAMSPSDHTAMEGVHARSVLYILDESKAIDDEMWDAAEGAASNAGADTDAEFFFLSASTPEEPQGRFFAIQSRKPGFEDWTVKVVTAATCIAEGQMSQEWYDQRLKQWGVDSQLFKNRVLGEFATADLDGVIPLEWAEAAMQRWVDAFGKDGEHFQMLTVERVGVDCSGTGKDQTVLARMCGNVFAPLERPFKREGGEVGEEEMATAGRTVALLKAYPSCEARIDGNGLGAGVVGRVREKINKERVHAFIASKSAGNRKDKTKELLFSDMRSWAWWSFREALDPHDGVGLLLPPDDELLGDLTAPHHKPLSGGRLKVESKDEIFKRLRRSTDAADAVIQAFIEMKAPVRSATAAKRRFRGSLLGGNQRGPQG